MKISQILSIALVSFVLFACDKGTETNTTSSTSNDKVEDTKTPAASVSLKEEDTPAEEGKLAKFEFTETQFDFGNIQQGDVVEHVFKFKNTGEAPLVITDTKTTCGCTTPTFTKDPVAPGEEGEILVKFNSTGKSGNTAKTITVLANVEGGRSLLRITTNILTEQAGPYKQ